MKQTYNIFKALLSLAIIMATASCYKDIGNYNYKELPDVKITAGDTIYATQFDTIKVPVRIDLDGYPETDYEYSWRVWSDAIGGDTMKQEISTARDLEYQVNLAAGTYSLVLSVINKKTNVNTYKELKLFVQSVISEGWMVLHEKNGKTDFDLLMSPFFSPRYDEDIRLSNVYESVNNERLEGRGVKIASYFSLGRYQYVTILTENGGVRLTVPSMQKAYDLPDLMFDKQPLRPQNYLYYSYYWCSGKGSEIIISDGRFYINKILGSGFSEPVFKNGETYKASPYGPKWMYNFQSILYDELKGRFLAVQTPRLIVEPLPSAAGRLFDWNNMNATLRYMEVGFNDYEYALMEDWDTKKQSLYVMNFDIDKDFDVAMYSADQCPQLPEAKYFTLGERGNVFFYATGTDIYQYDYAGTNTAKKVFSVKNGEQITGMKILKSTVDRFITSHPFNNKVLTISTYNETKGEGKVYMYNINESNGTIDISSEKVFEGFGRILDMEFNYPKYG